MRAPWWLPFGRVDEILPKEVLSDLRNGKQMFLLDVREPIEFSEDHIQGARNIPIRELSQKLDELNSNRQVPVVAICLSGHRSKPAYRLLKRAGYENVCSLQGGMLRWRHENLPTTRKMGE